MASAGNVASEQLRKVWQALAQVPEPLYLLVGKRTEAQAHLLGSFALERVDGEDLIVLRETRTHVHVDWSTITRLERADQDGHDGIRFLGRRDPVFQVLTSDPTHRYSPGLAALVEQAALTRS